jgi:uncharacterized protein YbjT (DUF2867 family)
VIIISSHLANAIETNKDKAIYSDPESKFLHFFKLHTATYITTTRKTKRKGDRHREEREREKRKETKETKNRHMMASGPFLITGITGNLGGATAEHLLAAKAIVHGVVRDLGSEKAQALAAAGVKLFKGDFGDPASLTAAMADVVGVFLNPIPSRESADAEVRGAQNVIDAAKATSNVQTVVLSTAIFAGDDAFLARLQTTADPRLQQLSGYYSRKAAIEAALRAARLPHYTIVRPPYLYHNYVAPWGAYHWPGLAETSTLVHAFGEGRAMPHLAAEDLGRIAAMALLDPIRFDGRELDPAVENLTADQAAAIMSTVSGQHVEARKMTPEEIPLSKSATLAFHIVTSIKDLAIDGATLETDLGFKYMTMEEYFTKHKAAFLKSLPAVSS